MEILKIVSYVNFWITVSPIDLFQNKRICQFLLRIETNT